ncbi:unnamed protein product [Chrysodeixis includens]|uniref:Uncharacterized protein n=1 Tax=Chrysodeixis includens TaxID=689277 RepID=A0A9N8PWM6_CHRIL|nr:unnamed protein product [Chrysodeixis includens]
MRKNDFGPDVSEDDDDIPVYVRPTSRARTVKPRIRTTTPPTTSTKYYIKSVSTRPTPFSSVNNQEVADSTENIINTEALIEAGLQNARVNEISSVAPNDTLDEQVPTSEYDRSQYTWNEPAVSPYKTLDNLRNTYKTTDASHTRSYTTSTTSTTVSTTTTRRPSRNRNTKKEKNSRSKPSYYSYRLEDEVIPDQTTEIFNGKVKTVIKAFLNSFVSSPAPQLVEEFSTTTTTPKPTTPLQTDDERVVNIGYQKKPLKYVDEKPLRSNVKHIKIITEPSVSRHVTPSIESISEIENENDEKDFPSTTTTMATMSSTPFTYANLPTSPTPIQSSTNSFRSEPSGRDSYQSKFSSFITNQPTKPVHEGSRKFQNIINDVQTTEASVQDVEIPDEVEVVKPTLSITDDFKITTTEAENHRINKVESEIASTTSTTKSTTTLKFEPTTSTTKSISFPTRASRVNPAIKLAATNPGGGRRSYQSSSKCSSDNSLQANPKCNEIKYQRYKYSPASSLSSLKLSHITY